MQFKRNHFFTFAGLYCNFPLRNRLYVYDTLNNACLSIDQPSLLSRLFPDINNKDRGGVGTLLKNKIHLIEINLCANFPVSGNGREQEVSPSSLYKALSPVKCNFDKSGSCSRSFWPPFAFNSPSSRPVSHWVCLVNRETLKDKTFSSDGLSVSLYSRPESLRFDLNLESLYRTCKNKVQHYLPIATLPCLL